MFLVVLFFINYDLVLYIFWNRLLIWLLNSCIFSKMKECCGEDKV